MRIGFGFYGISHGLDKKTGYYRDFRDCWENIKENVIQPFVDLKNEAVIYASTYRMEDKKAEEDFWSYVNPRKVIFSQLEGSDAFTAKSALHNAFDGEDLDLVVFTRFDILFHQKITTFPIDFTKVNIFFPEDPMWWQSHRFVCDCFYIWNHKFSDQVKWAMRETYGWPRGTMYPDTHGILNFLVPRIGPENISFMSNQNHISNVNDFYTLCRPNVPEHPKKHPFVKAKYG
jgi:hypothetical protein